MPEWERHDVLQDLVISAEVDAEFTYDVIIQATVRLESELMRQGIAFGTKSISYLHNPEIPGDTTNLVARSAAIRRSRQIGCQIIETHQGIIVPITVWIRNWGAMGVSPITVAENIAEYLVTKQFVETFCR